MSEEKKIDPRHSAARIFLRVAGPILIVVGIVLIIVGLTDFKGPSTPLYFFTGMPLLFLGGVMSMFGYMSAVARRQAGEIAPVERDAFGYPVEGAGASVGKAAGAVAEGLKQSEKAGVECGKCGRRNESDARFCDKCGAPLKGRTCPSCSRANASDAEFCSHCGGRLS